MRVVERVLQQHNWLLRRCFGGCGGDAAALGGTAAADCRLAQACLPVRQAYHSGRSAGVWLARTTEHYSSLSTSCSFASSAQAGATPRAPDREDSRSSRQADGGGSSSAVGFAKGSSGGGDALMGGGGRELRLERLQRAAPADDLLRGIKVNSWTRLRPGSDGDSTPSMPRPAHTINYLTRCRWTEQLFVVFYACHAPSPKNCFCTCCPRPPPETNPHSP
jgi:hypothetical protein